ncbi:flagellar hook-associated protein FlgL [Shewanella sp. SR44-3]|uniref:flagellar hook-associated protein FlgL n=1 Tax=unclassified Shewanella TaxID=196818 RepID=UPI0015FAACAC|nr:flagellar hook-associated protein FlgL [Shewanella sp. SR44-3]MBB1268394.1 flagellar hook-associated protein FlgL [Shewanella sp. SR44-3]
MRVTMQNLYTNNLNSLQNTTADVARLNQMTSQGLSILAPSDDPIGAVRVMASERDLAAVGQYIKNIDAVSTSLGRAETHLSSMVEVQLRMREIGVLASNGTLSVSDRSAYAAELDELLKSLVSSINAKDDGGNSIFAGNLVDKATVVLDASGKYVYQGDNNTRQVQTSPSSWIESNATAQEVLFGNGSQDILNATVDFVKALKDPSLSPGLPGFTAATASFQSSLDDTLNSINAVITDFGGKQNSLSLMKASHEEMTLFNKQVIGETQELDYAAATAEFNVKLTALKVTQQTFVQVSSLSLFDHMR